MAANRELIYIVDDEQSICDTLKGVLTDEGYSVATFLDTESFFEQIQHIRPSLVLLDIWLPGIDGMGVLSQIRQSHPNISVIMMSGHAGIEAAVNAIKLGAYDFLEKPLHVDVLLDKVSGALSKKKKQESPPLPSDVRLERASCQNDIRSGIVSLAESDQPQRTLMGNIVLNGTGLLSGRNTGIILTPLDENQGIIFQSLDGQSIPAHVTSLEGFSSDPNNHTFTANSTVLMANNRRIRTVEHLLAALYMYDLSNVLIKADEEVPNIDGSAKDFCRLIQEAGVVEQSANSKKIVFHEKLSIGKEHQTEKHMYIEPFDGFEVTMRVDYPAPIFQQTFTFNPKKQSFEHDIAPARSFNTFENIDMAQKMGKVGSGYLNSHIIMYDGKVINTKLKYPDEFVRHKILDLLGDLYLLGHPIQGRITANMTSHAFNQALAQKIYNSLP